MIHVAQNIVSELLRRQQEVAFMLRFFFFFSFFFGSAAVVTEAAAWQFELVQLMVPKVSCLSSGFKSSCWYKTE